MSDVILFISSFSKLCEEPIKIAVHLGIKIISMDSKDMRRYFPKVKTVPTIRFSNQIKEVIIHYYIFGLSQTLAWFSNFIEEEIEETKIDLKDISSEKGEDGGGGAPEIKSGSSK
jgi:hypothetical protein